MNLSIRFQLVICMAEEEADKQQGKLFRQTPEGKFVNANDHLPHHTVYDDNTAEAHPSPNAQRNGPKSTTRPVSKS